MRRDLPSGTVTFLFTDVEGSTKLLHELGAEAYAQALADHRLVLRRTSAAHGGVEVDTQGDAFFFAFPTAPGALAAAQAMTEQLASGPIQVRIGLHTGTPLLTDEGYVGDDVHFAARVAATGHGGQVVLSEATAELVEIGLTSLGSHRLKDIAEPVSIYQLGDRAFPPLKTIANTNLPTPASAFLGREQELYDADALLQETRLLTVTGPGGQGKTRFALELATRAREERFSDYRDGVFSCFFSSLRDATLVLPTIASTLSVREQPGDTVLESLSSHLRGKHMLLMLDNLEHLLEAAPELSELISSCAGLTMLCTSRELLRIDGERPYDLPALAEEEGVSLFCERSRLEPSETIQDLCTKLEGLPLAIELAAARIRILTPSQLLERLSQRLDLLKAGRDADPRQQTLRATIEWSHDLLTEEEQRLFARLSVFAGGCTLDAAEEVCDADLDSLQSLVDKSLVRFTEGRYWMLETIREYANERLMESGEIEETGRRHAEHYLTLAERSDTPLDRLGEEHDNMRAALSWFGRAGEADSELQLASALANYWVVRGHLSEARLHVEAALAIQAAQSPALRARGLAIASDFARLQGDVAEARAFCEESLALSRELGDPVGVAQALHELGEAAMAEDDLDGAVEFFEEAVTVARAAGRDGGGSIGNLGYVALLQGDYQRARALAEEAGELLGRRGHRSGVAVGLSNVAQSAVLLGSLEEARLRIRECLELAGELGFKEVIAECLDSTALLLADTEQTKLAARLTGAADGIREGINLSPIPAECRLRRRMREPLKASLGADVFETLYEQGRELGAEQATSLVLGALDA